MLKKDITYKTFDGEEVTDTFFFHISKPEIIKMDVAEEGGFGRKIQKIIDTKDAQELIKLFEEVIDLSIGEKSQDGKRFIKNDEIREAFRQSNAYEALYMEMIEDDEAGAKFINGVLPADLVEEMNNGGRPKDQDKPTGPPQPPKPPTAS